MKSKSFLFALLFFTITHTLSPLTKVARADDDPCGYDSDGDINDEDKCPKAPKKGPPNTVWKGSGTASGPSGVPATGASKPDNPGTPATPSAPGTSPVKASCSLLPPDDYKDDMTILLGRIQKACPNLGKDAGIVNDYVTNYLKKPVLPNGWDCQTFDKPNGPLMADYNAAKNFQINPPSPPANNVFDSCFQTDPVTGVLTLIDGCVDTTKGQLESQFKAACGGVRNTEYRQENLENAIKNLGALVNSPEKGACKDAVTPIMGFLGQMLGTTPLGLTAVVATQAVTGFAAKLFNSANKHDLTNILTDEAKHQKEGVTVCTYAHLMTGVLGCKDPDVPTRKPAASTSNSCTPDAYKELTPLIKAWRELDAKLGGITVDASKMNENTLIDINTTLQTQVATNPTTQKAINLSEYLAGIAQTKADDDFKTKISKIKLGKLVEKLNQIEAKVTAAETSGADLKPYQTDIATALTGLNGTNVPSPHDILSLMKLDTGGLQAALTYETSLSASSVENPFASDNGTSEESANHVLSALFSNKDGKNINVADIKDFVNTTVNKYETAKKDGAVGASMLQHEKKEAVQACSALAGSYFYEGGSNDLYENKSTINKNFQKDFGKACGQLFDEAPELKAINDGGNDPAKFKTNVCTAQAAEGMKAK